VDRTAPVAARGGTTYFAPRVRILRLGPKLVAEPEAGTELTFAQQDILRAEVTRVNSDAAQYSLTLNNWFDKPPADRSLTEWLRGSFPAPPGGQGPSAPVERLENGQALWPRFRYNDFQQFRFGDRLRIDMAYWPDPPPGPDAASAQNWVPMVAGPITDMRFTFSSGEGARVTISGEDDLSRLKDKSEKKVPFKDLSERGIVRKVLAEANYPLRDIAPSRVAWPPFAEGEAHGFSETLQGGQSYLEFLQKLAHRLDFEVFLEFDPPTVPGTSKEQAQGVAVAFHFEPARSLLPPDRTLRDVFVLHREQHLIEFTPTIKVIDQYTEVVVKGRHRDRNRPERVTGPARPDAVEEELHTDAERKDPPLKSGPAMREFFFPGRPNRTEAPNQTNLDPERARQAAAAMLRKKAREFMTVEGTTVGLPRLRPGNHVEIRGFRPPFDGFYYVTKTVHTYGADGMRTRFSARRPGMPEPPPRLPLPS
jgi:hypothetical protein